MEENREEQNTNCEAACAAELSRAESCQEPGAAVVEETAVGANCEDASAEDAEAEETCAENAEVEEAVEADESPAAAHGEVASESEPRRELREPLLDVNKLFSFKLDDFQIEAINAIDDNESVIVCAPTGSGKTVVAEYAIRRALSRGKRCFYTTPLKALSNQKFGDLRRVYGEENVGLLTGDTTVNRNAYIVVMTTEVYRNMLYGTVLGDVRVNLTHVESVIVDECHYMNDPDRGTVWEELVIYSPKEIQLIALSATVANAHDLRDWFQEIHGPTHLVESSYRPVPLRTHYYFDGRVYPLINEKGRLNTKLKRQVEAGQAQLQAARKAKAAGNYISRELMDKMKQATPDMVVSELDKTDMLPCIYFLFSRKKCDEAARNSDKAVQLSDEHRAALNKAIDEAILEHPALADNPQLPHLRNGIAAHHAGLLPLWKVLVENLFQQGLIKVVYATETLAAGINMPARTTVISAILKYSDEGLRPMTASEFLQMSGRAGRRGMDEVGHVVVVHHPLEPLQSAADLARADADPLVSRFTPGYGMVLNLLQRHTTEEARELIERSFGQFVADHDKGALAEEAEKLRQAIEELSVKRCPEGTSGDLEVFRKMRDKGDALGRQLNALRRSSRSVAPKEDFEVEIEGDFREAPVVAANDLEEEMINLRARRDDLRRELKSMPCFDCEFVNSCGKQTRDIKRLEKRLKDIDGLIELSRTSYWRQFLALEGVLTEADYVVDDKPTWQGEMASGFRATNVFFLCEVALSGVFDDLLPAEIAGIMSALVVGDTRAVPEIPMRPSQAAEDVIEYICSIASDVEYLQNRYNVKTPVFVNSVFSGLTEFWCRGADWEHVRNYLGWDEGDLIKAMRRTLDLLRQFIHAPHMPEHIVSLCHEAEALIDRDEVHEAVLWAD